MWKREESTTLIKKKITGNRIPQERFNKEGSTPKVTHLM